MNKEKDDWTGILTPKLNHQFLLSKIKGFDKSEADILKSQLVACDFIIEVNSDAINIDNYISNFIIFTFENDKTNKIEKIISNIRPAFVFNFEISHVDSNSIELSKIKCDNAKFAKLSYSLDYNKNEPCKFMVTFECEEMSIQK